MDGWMDVSHRMAAVWADQPIIMIRVQPTVAACPLMLIHRQLQNVETATGRCIVVPTQLCSRWGRPWPSSPAPCCSSALLLTH